MNALLAWFGYLTFAFIALPILFRARFGRWPFVVPPPLTRYSTIEACYAVIYFVYCVAMICRPLPPPLSARIGTALLVGAVAVQIWAMLAMGPSWRIGFDPQRDHCDLVRRGPYRLVRHPIYWSLIAVAISQLLLTRVDWPSIMLLGSTLLYFFIQTADENKYWYPSSD